VTLGKKVIGVQKWNTSVRSRISEIIRQDMKFMLDLERIYGISEDGQIEGTHCWAQELHEELHELRYINEN